MSRVRPDSFDVSGQSGHLGLAGSIGLGSSVAVVALPGFEVLAADVGAGGVEDLDVVFVVQDGHAGVGVLAAEQDRDGAHPDLALGIDAAGLDQDPGGGLHAGAVAPSGWGRWWL